MFYLAENIIYNDFLNLFLMILLISYYIHTDCKILNTDTPFKPLLILLYIIVYETISVKNETFMTYSINLLTYMSLYIG